MNHKIQDTVWAISDNKIRSLTVVEAHARINTDRSVETWYYLAEYVTNPEKARKHYGKENIFRTKQELLDSL